MAEGFKAYTVRMDHTGALYVSRGIKTSWSQEFNSRVVTLGGSNGAKILVTGSKPGRGVKNQVLRTVSIVELCVKGREWETVVGLEDHAGNVQSELGSGIVLHIDLRRPKGVPSTGASSFYNGAVENPYHTIAVGFSGCKSKANKNSSIDALVFMPHKSELKISPQGWSGRRYELMVSVDVPTLTLKEEALPKHKKATTAEIRRVRKAESRARHLLALVESDLVRDDLSKEARGASIRESRSLAHEIAQLEQELSEFNKVREFMCARARKTGDRRALRRRGK